VAGVGGEVKKMATISIQKPRINVGDAKDMARHAALLAKARRARNEAARELLRSLPKELGRLNATLKTLLAAKSEEFFEVYAERERILSAWKELNKPTIEKLANAMREYFANAETIAEIADRTGLSEEVELSSIEITE
jgi:hypothetical protein